MPDQIHHAAAFHATPPLVGRERELAALRDALASAMAGRGSLVLIGGEAGIGKTALAEWLLPEAQDQGALVLVGRCYDLSETPPYGPWRELFARAPRGEDLPTLPQAVLPAAQRGEALASQDAIIERTQAYLATVVARHPGVLLLDDLHWADSASLDLLRIVARSSAGLPLLLLATYRADEVARAHPLHALLPVLVREARAIRLGLRPLDATAIGAFVAARYGLAAGDHARLTGYLAGRSEGNALFLGELLRTLEGEGLLRQDTQATAGDDRWGIGDLDSVAVPPLLRQVIERRLYRLPQATEQLLAIAAIVGHDVPLALWANVGEVTEGDLLDHIERALEARLLIEVPDGRGVRFAHALIREALYAQTPALRRRVLHRQAGEALAALLAPDPDAVAYHFRQAGDPRAAEWLLRAGGRARRDSAWLTAADRFEAALPWLERAGAPPGERAWTLYAVARLRVFAHPERSQAALEAAVPLAAEADDPALLGYVGQLRGLALCIGGAFDHGLAAMADGVASLERATLGEFADPLHAAWGAPPDVAQLRGQLATWLAYAGRFAEVADLLARAAADPGPLSAYYHSAAGLMHLAQGRPLAARRALARSRAANRAREAYFQVGFTAFFELNWGVLRYQADDLAARRALVAECEQAMARASGVLAAGLAPRLARLPAAFAEGRWAEVRALAQHVRLENPPLAHYANPLDCAVAIAQGELAQAQAVVDEELAAGAATPPGRTFLHPTLSLLHLAPALALGRGDLPLARAWLEASERWLAWAGAVLGRAEGQLDWATYHRAAGDLAAARAHAETAMAHATEPRQPLALLAARRLLGELATDAAAYAEAEVHLAGALALADACAAPYERALTLLALADMHAAAGRRAEADVSLAEARALLEPLEAAPALARAATLAARLTSPTGADAGAPVGLPFGLTVREAEVLRLVAEGLPDLQIAGQLFVTRNTVSFHLKAIYSKLGVTSRAAATRLALDHGLV